MYGLELYYVVTEELSICTGDDDTYIHWHCHQYLMNQNLYLPLELDVRFPISVTLSVMSVTY
jgi:hypothetical protein